MINFRTCVVCLAAAILVSACQTTTGGPQPGTQATTLDEVISLTDRVCGASRPDFATATDRMMANGLTIQKDDRFFSPSKDLSGNVGTSDDGLKVCSIRSTFFQEDELLTNILAARFGGLMTKDQIFGPFIRVYDRGSKGKLLLFTQLNNRGNRIVYDLGYAEGF